MQNKYFNKIGNLKQQINNYFYLNKKNIYIYYMQELYNIK